MKAVTTDFKPDIPAVHAPVPALPTAEVLGVPLALTDYERTMDWMDAMVARAPARRTSCAAAVHLVMVAQEDAGDLRRGPGRARLHRARRAAARVGAARARPPRRVARLRAGADGALLRARGRAPGTRMFLYGGRNQGALVQLALNLRQRYPGLKIVGGYSPPFRAADDAEERRGRRRDQPLAAPTSSGSGIGQPKQEKWMAEMRDALDAPVLVGVGAAFDFHAGLVPQAPPWMQAMRPRVGSTASPTSRGGCGGATRATTRASSPASCGSTAAHRKAR